MDNTNGLHPEYQFDPIAKKETYEMILRAVAGQKVIRACSFPNLSDYAFEKMLLAAHPECQVDCFEKNRNTCVKMLSSFVLPHGITLLNEDVEQWVPMSRATYDLMFLDYMAGPGEGFGNLIERLNDNGVLAMTEYVGRGRKIITVPPGLVECKEALRYGLMVVRLFRRSLIPENNFQAKIIKHGQPEILGHQEWSQWLSVNRLPAEKSSENRPISVKMEIPCSFSEDLLKGITEEDRKIFEGLFDSRQPVILFDLMVKKTIDPNTDGRVDDGKWRNLVQLLKTTKEERSVDPRIRQVASRYLQIAERVGKYIFRKKGKCHVRDDAGLSFFRSSESFGYQEVHTQGVHEE